MSHQALDIVIVTAGYFGKESFDEPDFDAQLDMYKVCLAFHSQVEFESEVRVTAD